MVEQTKIREESSQVLLKFPKKFVQWRTTEKRRRPFNDLDKFIKIS